MEDVTQLRAVLDLAASRGYRVRRLRLGSLEVELDAATTSADETEERDVAEVIAEVLR